MVKPFVTYHKFWLAVIFTLLSTFVFAIDNPDAPDLSIEFEKREMVFLKKIDDPKNTSRDYLIAYDDYQTFLETEMTKAYQLIHQQLPATQKKQLAKSQRSWLTYKNKEFTLINNTWTSEHFGSSAALSRGTYRCSLMKNRINQLLSYAKNFP